jgi:hypothetical protein
MLRRDQLPVELQRQLKVRPAKRQEALVNTTVLIALGIALTAAAVIVTLVR